MRTAKPEIAANTAVCDGAHGSISGSLDKIREKGVLSSGADKTPYRQNAVPTKLRAAENDMGTSFLAKYDGRSRFLSLGERKVRRIFAKQMRTRRGGWVRRNVRNNIRARDARCRERDKTRSLQSRLQYVHIARKTRFLCKVRRQRKNKRRKSAKSCFTNRVKQ